jgi:HPt (histidine-containing phosphotransfer) domain-containing protein
VIRPDPAARLNFDEAQVLASLGGDTTLFTDIIVMFLERSVSLEDALRGALAERDAPALKVAAHQLVGSVGLFERGALLESLRWIERQDELGDGSIIHERLAWVSAQLELLRAELSAVLGRLRPG